MKHLWWNFCVSLAGFLIFKTAEKGVCSKVSKMLFRNAFFSKKNKKNNYKNVTKKIKKNEVFSMVLINSGFSKMMMKFLNIILKKVFS